MAAGTKPAAAAETPPSQRARDYIAGVLDGSIVVGRYVRLAVERHVRDLEHGHERGLWFDEKRAERSLRLYQFLRHSKGKWAGKPLELSGWQAFILWSVFGWKRADGTRRFRTAYVEVARKNGKSTFSAGVGIELLLCDGEAGAEVYTAATKKDQARIVHGEATRMVKASPALRQRIRVGRDNLCVEGSDSKFEPLGADGDTLDGLNVSGAIIDELHAHKSRLVWDVIETATGARTQPLIWAITTAGHDQQSICWEIRDYCVKALEGTFGAEACDATFAYIATIDKDDDWTDERCWIKANPNLGVSVELDEMREKCGKAKLVPGARNAFLRLRLNRWTEQENLWLDLDKWDVLGEPFDPATLKGRRCFGGLDLASKIDLTCFSLIFPPDDGDAYWRVLPQFWIPDETAHERERQDRVPYADWIERGLIVTTPGGATDYSFVETAVIDAVANYKLIDVGYDGWNASQTANVLQAKGVTCWEFRQGYASLTEPSKELERLIVAKLLRHGGHPVLRWNAQCVAVKEDENGNIRPVKPKKKSGKRIDGIVASIMALGRAIVAAKERQSCYDTRGVRTIE